MAKGLYERQLAEMHAGARLFCDETPMRVLDPGRGRTKTCQFWAHATDDRALRGPAPPAVAYVFAAGRGKKEIVQQLAGFAGVLQVDAYAAYKGLARDQRAAVAIRASLLSGACPAQVCRRCENHELAVGPGGGGADRSDLCDRKVDPRPHCRRAPCASQRAGR